MADVRPESARTPAQDGGTAEVVLVVVELAGRRIAVRLSDVVEVQRMVALTPLPAAPDVVEGLVDLRGELVAVLDVRARFDLAPSAASPSDQLVILRAGARTVGMRVDDALGLRTVTPGAIDPSPSDIPGVAHVAGVARDDEGLLVVHDLATFLSWDEARQLDDALAEHRFDS